MKKKALSQYVNESLVLSSKSEYIVSKSFKTKKNIFRVREIATYFSKIQ